MEKQHVNFATMTPYNKLHIKNDLNIPGLGGMNNGDIDAEMLALANISKYTNYYLIRLKGQVSVIYHVY